MTRPLPQANLTTVGANGLTFLGFVGFFVWMAAMGLALLRRRSATEELAPVAAQG